MCTNNEDKIAEEVCYPRTKNVIKGYKFKGTIKQELLQKIQIIKILRTMRNY